MNNLEALEEKARGIAIAQLITNHLEEFEELKAKYLEEYLHVEKQKWENFWNMPPQTY